MRTLLLAAAVLAAGCGGPPPSPPHRHPAQPSATASAPVQLGRAEACRRLLEDVRRNQGIPDVRALREIADHVTAPRLAADARTAVRDIGHTGIAPVAFALLRDDCARAGVHIPAP
jgi:hypothetical protein